MACPENIGYRMIVAGARRIEPWQSLRTHGDDEKRVKLGLFARRSMLERGDFREGMQKIGSRECDDPVGGPDILPGFHRYPTTLYRWPLFQRCYRPDRYYRCRSAGWRWSKLLR